MKTVVTMTSWKGRISDVGFAIYRFMDTQVVKPDLFYLWLAEEEFPRLERDLPDDLLKICNYYNVNIKWVKQNEYCHKRWYVFPEHNDDLVISIDDDVFYDVQLIMKAQEYASIYTNTIINIGTPEYHTLTFNHSIARKFGKYHLDEPVLNIQFCGQCIVLPNSFPIELLEPTYVMKRKRYCTKCDESLVTPFLVKNGTKIMAHKWNNKVDQALQSNAISNEMKTKKDLQIYTVIRVFDECMKPWKRLYPNYDTTSYDNIHVDKIAELL